MLLRNGAERRRLRFWGRLASRPPLRPGCSRWRAACCVVRRAGRSSRKVDPHQSAAGILVPRQTGVGMIAVEHVHAATPAYAYVIFVVAVAHHLDLLAEVAAVCAACQVEAELLVAAGPWQFRRGRFLGNGCRRRGRARRKQGRGRRQGKRRGDMFLGPGKGSEVVILVPAAVARPMRYISLRTAGRRFAGAPGEHLDDCSRAEVRDAG